MEKTVVTKVIFYLAWKLLKILVKRTDNKLDDGAVQRIEDLYNDSRGL